MRYKFNQIPATKMLSEIEFKTNQKLEDFNMKYLKVARILTV
ncbi:hypothetical protein IIU_05383 [Bacillus cereus VD133]|uniref:Uncharacterized protein n=1 Tax=Bacillus cereus VD133 TaxID=1053233 RepID=A0A9W5PM70_BACCE|nr:hypothetical protein [Bacillus cereus]EOO29553.1 hypothetical protein IIU_05383 [Bacillus cereus VD133]